MTTYRAQEYIDGVQSGDIITCKYVKQAVQRHVNDIKRQNTPDFPYYFDDTEPKRVIRFTHHLCYHVKGEFARRKERVILEPWEQFIVWVMFGWRKADGYRKYNTVFIEVAKKNGKSTFVSCLGLYLFFADKEPGAEVYSGATTRDQAKIIFNDYARAMVLKDPDLKEAITVLKHAMTYQDNSVFRPVSSDYDSLDGFNVHCALIDEYHAHKDDGVYNILAYNMAARKQPMMIIITTAGFDPDVPCYDEEEYAKQVLSGVFINESYFAIIYTLDEADAWDDKTIWPKSNPNLGVSKDPDAMDRDYQKAKDKPAEQNKFKNKHLNIWTRAESQWIRLEDWQAISHSLDEEELKGKPAYAGIDLSKSGDTTSYALCWQPAEQVEAEGVEGEQSPPRPYRLKLYFFLPDFEIEEREKKEKVPWRQWAEQGFITLTYGRVVDYDYVQALIEHDAGVYDIRELGYDPWNAPQFTANLFKAGFGEKLVEISQNPKNISPAAKDFEKKILNKELIVEPNPVMDWMIGNCEIKSDSKDNIYPVKPDSRKTYKHIDGIFSAMMALDRAVRNEKAPSVYESRGLVVVGGEDFDDEDNFYDEE